MSYRVIIVDDERLAREELKFSLKEYSSFQIIGEAADADEAEQLIRELKPDLLFLDIQMPGRSGLDLLESLEKIPEVVFVTAFDQYAVKAFELEAIDYLVKPFRKERFFQTMDRVAARLNNSVANQFPERLFIREGDRYLFVDLAEVRLMESSGNYVKLHVNGKRHYLKRSLTHMEEMLDPAIFFRINRNEIVNLNFITEVLKEDNGRISITLKNGEKFELSSRQSAAFRNRNPAL